MSLWSRPLNPGLESEGGNMKTIVKVICKCVGCGAKKEVGTGEVSKGEVPMCDKCYMPMVAEKTIQRRPR